MRYEIQLPGSVSSTVTVETSLFGLREVSVAGMPVSRGPGRGHPFLVPLAAGGFGELTHKFGWTQSSVVFQGQRYPLGRKLNRIEAGLVLLPLGLGLLFGLLGVVTGAAAALLNGVVMRANVPGVVRVGIALAATIVAAGLAFYVAVGLRSGVFITPDWEKVGACWQSVPTGDVASIPTIDCSQGHKAEVYAVGVVEPSEIGGGFDAAKLDAWAQQHCLVAFEPFVGIAFENSRLGVQFVLPTSITWAVGDRLVVCAIIDPDGQQLVGSMRGTGK